MKLGLYAQKICHSIRRSVSERSEAQVEELMDQPLYDVFLGGSCGKTVWRRDYVIPYLKKRAISYYDPQRSEWSESLIEEESIAKENSKLFLFVLEPSTVNATSFLEIAYFAAKSSPRLVVVFLKRSEWSCRGHPKDMPDRHRTCSLLDAILTRHQVPCLQSIPEALDYIDEMILGNRSLAAILRDGRSLSPYLSIQGRRAMRQARSAFESFGNKAAHLVQGARSGRFPVVVCVLAVIALPVTQLATLALLHLFVQNIPLYVAVIALFVTTDMAVAGLALGLSAASAKRTQPNAMLSPSTPLAPLGSATVARNRLRTMMTPQESRSVISYDVFVSCSGTAPADLEWIDQSVVPQLNKHGLSYCSLATCGRERQLAVMRNSQHILYYIPSFRTFLSGMVEIAYLLGQSDWQVTICVPKEAEFMDGSPMEELNSKDLTVDDEKRSIERRNQCYSIAFCYLKDMAHRRKAQVFSRLSDAMAHVVTSAALNQRF